MIHIVETFSKHFSLRLQQRHAFSEPTQEKKPSFVISKYPSLFGGLKPKLSFWNGHVRHLSSSSSSSLAMDLKKLAFSDQFPYCSSPGRRKIVSGFGLGVVVSLIVLSLVLFNVSVHAPFFPPVFQVSWPFSFSSTASSSSASGGLQSSVDDLKQRVGGGRVVDKTHEANSSVITENGSFVGSNGESVGLEETHVSSSSERLQNSVDLKRSVGEGRVGDQTHQADVSVITQNGNNASLEKTHVGNFSEKVKNGSFNGDLVAGKSVIGENVGFTDNSSTGKLMSSEKTNSINVTGSVSQSMEGHSGFKGKCDLFDGRWVRDDAKPYYPGGSCPYIDRDFDCHLNRRPDDGFLKWKWQPYGCDIPSLNATDFLERLRGKKLVFVGDSLNRNMWESLVCILRQSIRNKKRVYEISGRQDFKKKGFYAFRFEDYNCTVDFVSAPFLVRESSFNGRNGSIETLRLDLMDKTTLMYHDADIVVFNTGHWWTHEKTSRGEDYYQEGNHIYPRLKVLEAYKRAITTWARWVDKNIDGSRTQVIFRGYSVTHFSGGQWNSGGQCHKETEPIFNETYLAKYPSKMRALEYVIQEMQTPVIYLNISRLTDYRKDGHPSIYRKEYKTVEEQIAAAQSQDCSHWCLPGVPDTWNELLYASLLQAGKRSWRR
ncbi:unnamed protein product [Camellia sinensis]